jgi:uncharacterized membrane protein
MNIASERVVVERLLRAGMALSTLLFLAGILVAFSEGGMTPRGLPLFAIAAAAREGEVGEAVAAVGVLVLAATPVVRVLALACLWAREKDFRFMWISLVVAAVLAFSILSGKG